MASRPPIQVCLDSFTSTHLIPVKNLSTGANLEVPSQMILECLTEDKSCAEGRLVINGRHVVVTFTVTCHESKRYEFDSISLHFIEDVVQLCHLQVKVQDICSVLFRGFLDISRPFDLFGNVTITVSDQMIPQCFLQGFWPKSIKKTINAHGCLISMFNLRYRTKAVFKESDFAKLDPKTKSIVSNALGLDVEELTYAQFVDNWCWKTADQPKADVVISDYVRNRSTDDLSGLGDVEFVLLERERSIQREIIDVEPHKVNPKVLQDLQARYCFEGPKARVCQITKDGKAHTVLVEKIHHEKFFVFVMKSLDKTKVFGEIGISIENGQIVIRRLKSFASQISRFDKAKYSNIYQALVQMAICCCATSSLYNKSITVYVPPQNSLSEVFLGFGFKQLITDKIARLSMTYDPEQKVKLVLAKEQLEHQKLAAVLNILHNTLVAIAAGEMPEGLHLLEIEDCIVDCLKRYCTLAQDETLFELVSDIFNIHPEVVAFVKREESKHKPDPEEPIVWPGALFSEYPHITYGAVFIALSYIKAFNFTLADSQFEQPLPTRSSISTKYPSLSISREFLTHKQRYFTVCSTSGFSSLIQPRRVERRRGTSSSQGVRRQVTTVKLSKPAATSSRRTNSQGLPRLLDRGKGLERASTTTTNLRKFGSFLTLAAPDTANQTTDVHLPPLEEHRKTTTLRAGKKDIPF